MQIITELKDINKKLKRYAGAKLSLSIYSTTLRRIALKLVHPDIKEVAYLVSVGTLSYCGKMDYEAAELMVEVDHNEEELLTRIIDLDKGFKLVSSGGVTMAIGEEWEFGDTFDDFLGTD